MKNFKLKMQFISDFSIQLFLVLSRIGKTRKCRLFNNNTNQTKINYLPIGFCKIVSNSIKMNKQVDYHNFHKKIINVCKYVVPIVQAEWKTYII